MHGEPQSEIDEALNQLILRGAARAQALLAGFMTAQVYAMPILREYAKPQPGGMPVFSLTIQGTSHVVDVCLKPDTLTEARVHARLVAVNGEARPIEKLPKVTLRNAHGVINIVDGWKD
jgi:hypothetical protein